MKSAIGPLTMSLRNYKAATASFANFVDLRKPPLSKNPSDEQFGNFFDMPANVCGRKDDWATVRDYDW